jgi:hypothetical protein
MQNRMRHAGFSVEFVAGMPRLRRWVSLYDRPPFRLGMKINRREFIAALR